MHFVMSKVRLMQYILAHISCDSGTQSQQKYVVVLNSAKYCVLLRAKRLKLHGGKQMKFPASA